MWLPKISHCESVEIFENTPYISMHLYAPVESWFASLKVECVDGVRYKSWDEARSSLFDYIEKFYNRQRLHSSLGYLSPLDYEQQYDRLLHVA